MSSPIRNVLFLCTGNTARSILAEALIDHLGHGRFKGHSGGSFPKGEIHPLAVEMLRKIGLPSEGFRSKSWVEFAQPGAPEMDFVFTVCDDAANEVCPVWPGHPVTAHWSIPDPTAVVGTPDECAVAFRQALSALEARIRLFTALPFAALDRLSLVKHVGDIGRGA